jgi:hypothetical protein
MLSKKLMITEIACGSKQKTRFTEYFRVPVCSKHTGKAIKQDKKAGPSDACLNHYTDKFWARLTPKKHFSAFSTC